jgi:hypothetical protein
VVREDNGVNKKVQKHFGAVRLFCMIIKWWIHVAKFARQRVNPTVKKGWCLLRCVSIASSTWTNAPL